MHVQYVLTGQFYVPILRPEDDDALPAILGKPFSPSQGGSPLSSIETTPVKAGPSSPLTLNAIAGPMSPSRVGFLVLAMTQNFLQQCL